MLLIIYCGISEQKVLATTQADALVQTAKGQKGVHERTSNSDNIKYNDEYYGHSVKNSFSGQYSWCAVFVWWCAKENNISTNIIPKTASALGMRNTMIKRGGVPHPKHTGYKPQKGDIFFFDYGNGHGHVGIVESSSGDSFYCIEGNYTGTNPHEVHYGKRSLNDNRLWGFVTPKYVDGGDNQKPTITNIKVTDITKSGYTVTCTATDNNAIDRVQFPTWTQKNGQDDITKGWETAASCKGSKNGNTYSFKVKRSQHSNEFGNYITHIYAYDKSGNSTCAVVPTVKLDVADSPVIQSASSQTNNITIKWNKVEGATSYRIDRRISGNGTSYKTVASVKSSVNSYKDTGLSVGMLYYYRVYAISDFGCSKKLNGYGAYTAPPATSIKSVQTDGVSQLTLTWNSVKSASSYLVSRRKSGTDTYQDIKTVTGTSYTDKGLEAGSGYWYKIYALNATGKSAASDGGYGMTRCTAPYLSVIDTSQIKVSWKASVGKTAYQYDVYRKSATESSYQKVISTKATSFIDKRLKANTKYIYKIIVVETEGLKQATYSAEASATTASVPNAPIIKIANQDTRAITISWEPIPYAKYYEVYRKSENQNDFKSLGRVSSTSYIDRSVTNGMKYIYYVKTQNDAGISKASNEASGYAVLPAPKTVSCTAKGNTSIEVNWSKVPNADGYLIRRRMDGEKDYTVIMPCIKENTFTDKGLEPGTKYYYKIRTWTGNYVSDVSDYGKATTEKGVSKKLTTPTLQLETQSMTSIKLSWNSIKGATKYEIYRRLGGEDYPQTPTYTVTGTSLIDKNLKAGTAYWYRIYAVNNKVKSIRSSGLMCRTKPEQPKVTVSPIDKSSIKAMWTSVKGATIYKLNIRKAGDESYETVTTTNNTSYVIGGLDAGTKYYIRVYAITYDASSFTNKVISEKDAGVGVITKYDPANCIHNYNSWVVTQRATCTDKGVRYHICSKCDKRETQNISPLGHDYGSDWTTLKEVTCEEDGAKCLKCKNCGENGNITIIKATGHNYKDIIIEKAATCSEEGVGYRICSVCGNRTNEVLEKLEHEYDTKILREPTVDEEGILQYQCKFCGHSYRENTEKLIGKEVVNIELNSNDIFAKEAGETFQLIAIVSPNDATDKKVIWSSSNEAVATVDESGLVTTMKTGKAAIFAESEDGEHFDICDVTVGNIVYAESISLDKNNINFNKLGDVDLIKTKVYPADAIYQQVEWYSDDEDVAIVNDVGSVTAMGEGETDIVAYIDDSDIVAVCHVDVKLNDIISSDEDDTMVSEKESIGLASPQDRIFLNANLLPMQKGQKTSVLKILHQNKEDVVEKWVSSNPKVVTVNKMSGVMKARKVGTAIVTVYMKNGLSASCKIRVQKNRVKTKKIFTDVKKLSLKRGEEKVLLLKRNPLTANDKITYNSSNKKVAVVNAKGKIIAKSKGQGIITAKTNTGKKLRVRVVVK